MRTIKFRGKRINRNGEWAYGDLRILPDRTLILPQGSYDAAIDRDAVDESTIGQFTGFLDKDGKEIYEGDIIHLKWNNYDKDFGIVKWHTDGYFYIDDNFGKFPKDKTNPIGNFFDFIRRDFKGIEASISGNIHDNPDLLKNND